jgi:mRNA interferase HigB
MVVISKGILNRYFIKNPWAAACMLEWYDKVKRADWSNFSELKQTFNSADYAEGLYIFDIGGNKYRIIARIIFKKRTVFLRFVGSHQEYDRIRLQDL